MSVRKLPITFAALTLLSSGAAFADWKLVDSDGRLQYFVDLDTMKVSGSKRRIWTLGQAGPENGSLSIGALMEYDCEEGTERMISAGMYAEPMGKGYFKPADATYPEAKHAAPGTPGHKRLLATCRAPSR